MKPAHFDAAPPLWSWLPDSTYMYFMRSGDYIKVGISNNPERRRRELLDPLNDTAMPDDWNGEIQLIAHVPGNRATEMSVHQDFAHLRVKGEWFRAAPELIEEMHMALLWQSQKELELYSRNVQFMNARLSGTVFERDDVNFRDMDSVVRHAVYVTNRSDWAFSERELRECRRRRAAREEQAA